MTHDTYRTTKVRLEQARRVCTWAGRWPGWRVEDRRELEAIVRTIVRMEGRLEARHRLVDLDC